MSDEQIACSHCWHDTGRMYMTNPPQAEEICCWCGAKRTLRINQYFPPGEHGKFAPHLGRV